MVPSEQSNNIITRVDSFVSKNTDTENTHKWTEVYKSQAARDHIFMDTSSRATGSTFTIIGTHSKSKTHIYIVDAYILPSQ